VSVWVGRVVVGGGGGGGGHLVVAEGEQGRPRAHVGPTAAREGFLCYARGLTAFCGFVLYTKRCSNENTDMTGIRQKYTDDSRY